ncbi:MAG: signal peptidase I [Clostridiales bacterium]|nr:signal peptidase I [Clostridiales bacterium]
MLEDENKQLGINGASEEADKAEEAEVQTLGNIMAEEKNVAGITAEVNTAAESFAEEKPAESTPAAETETSGKKASKGFKLEKGTTAYEIFDWVRTICIGVLAGIFIVVFLVQKDNVYGDSMSPTLSSGDAVFAQKISNYFKSYKRGDIVVLDGHDMEGYTKKEYLIKRVIGLPGESVRIADGNVYIKPADADEYYLLQENYLPSGTKTIMMLAGLDKGYDEVTLGEDEYYVLGDNRPVSNDSRYLGPFTSDRIKGVAIVRVYPFNEMKVL